MRCHPGEGAAASGSDRRLRATSTIGTALVAEAASVPPVEGVEEAEAWRQADPLTVLAGERSLRPRPGFGYGHSPAALPSRQATGRRVVLATARGRWLGRAATGAGVLAPSLR